MKEVSKKVVYNPSTKEIGNFEKVELIEVSGKIECLNIHVLDGEEPDIQYNEDELKYLYEVLKEIDAKYWNKPKPATTKSTAQNGKKATSTK